jgi:putative DNA primase/helicase
MSLASFLKGHKKSGEITHTRIGNTELEVYGGSYTIPDDDMAAFYQAYHAEVFHQCKSEYLTEQQRECGPLVVDLDFRQNTPERKYTKAHILEFIETLLVEIGTVCEDATQKFPVYVYEKDNVNTTDPAVTKDGIHMYFGISMDRTIKGLLRTRMLAKMSIWDDLKPFMTNNWDGLIDSGVMVGTVGWPVYGSTKPGYPPYKLKMVYMVSRNEETHMFNLEGEKLSTFSVIDNLYRMSVRYPSHEVLAVAPGFKEEYERLKSGTKAKAKMVVSEAKASMEYGAISTMDQLDAAVAEMLETLDPYIDYKVKNAYIYTMCLPETYYGPQSYDKWIKVGFALKHTDPRLFIVWVKFSSQSPSFSFDMLDKLQGMWNGWKDVTLSWRSIVYWARTDVPDKYHAAKKQAVDYHVNALFQQKTPVVEYDYARVLYHTYSDRYVCVSIQHKCWFEYLDQRWQEVDSGVTLRRKISDLTSGISHIVERKMAEVEKVKDEASNRLVVKLRGMLTDLKKTDKKANIMREACDLFYQPRFIDKLDSKNHILCCSNGVFDFSTNTFRPGIPEDWTSKSTNNPYIEDMSEHVDTVREIESFMMQLFPEEELRRYMWDHAASVLLGKNNNQTFNMYMGNGRNGKSKFVELLGKAIGEYKATIPISLITQKRTTLGGTASEVVQLRGIRYAVMQEPSKGDVLNEGVMKELTGGDPIQARALYKDTVTFTPQFKLVVCMNTFLEIKSLDDGTWRRIRVCEFKSIFNENPVEGDIMAPYQFKVDKNIDEKFEVWKTVLLNMLIRRAQVTHGNVEDCRAVLQQADNYRQISDPFAEFINCKIVSKKDGMIKDMELYETFRDWWTAENNGSKAPPKKDVIAYICKRFGQRTKVSGVMAWHGISIIYPGADSPAEP